jgi:hypothetical protein
LATPGGEHVVWRPAPGLKPPSSTPASCAFLPPSSFAPVGQLPPRLASTARAPAAGRLLRHVKPPRRSSTVGGRAASTAAAWTSAAASSSGRSRLPHPLAKCRARRSRPLRSSSPEPLPPALAASSLATVRRRLATPLSAAVSTKPANLELSRRSGRAERLCRRPLSKRSRRHLLLSAPESRPSAVPSRPGRCQRSTPSRSRTRHFRRPAPPRRKPLLRRGAGGITVAVFPGVANAQRQPALRPARTAQRTSWASQAKSGRARQFLGHCAGQARAGRFAEHAGPQGWFRPVFYGFDF